MLLSLACWAFVGYVIFSESTKMHGETIKTFKLFPITFLQQLLLIMYRWPSLLRSQVLIWHHSERNRIVEMLLSSHLLQYPSWRWGSYIPLQYQKKPVLYNIKLPQNQPLFELRPLWKPENRNLYSFSSVTDIVLLLVLMFLGSSHLS